MLDIPTFFNLLDKIRQNIYNNGLVKGDFMINEENLENLNNEELIELLNALEGMDEALKETIGDCNKVK